MRRRWRLLAAIAALPVLAVLANTGRHWGDVSLIEESPGDRHARLAAHWRMVPDEDAAGGAGAILLSGCDGVHDNMDWWAAALAGALGRPALILDSHRPRGLHRFEGWRLVCAGQALPGPERAGDIAVAMAASDAPRLVLLGASHGGWAVLEYLRQLAEGDLAPGLTDWPAPPAALRARLGPVVLLYPYCGLLNRAEGGDWSHLPPILMIAAAEDRIVSNAACETLAADLRGRGARIETLVLPGVDHGFDQQDRSPLSVLTFHPEARDAAWAAARAFLEREG